METERMVFQATDDLVSQIDDWRFANRIATRAEALRRLVMAGLKAPIDEPQPKSSKRKTPR